MAEELKFALKCHGSRQRPALRRGCNKCHAPASTHVPTTDLMQQRKSHPDDGHDPDDPADDGNNDSSLSTCEIQQSAVTDLQHLTEYPSLRQTIYLPHESSLLPINGVRDSFTASSGSPFMPYQYQHHQSQQFQTSSPLNSSPTSSPTPVPSWSRRCMSLKTLTPIPPSQNPNLLLPLNQPNVIPASASFQVTGPLAPPIRFGQQEPILLQHQLLNQIPIRPHILQQQEGDNPRKHLEAPSQSPSRYPVPLPNFLPVPYVPRSPTPLPSSPSLSSLPDPLSCS